MARKRDKGNISSIPSLTSIAMGASIGVGGYYSWHSYRSAGGAGISQILKEAAKATTQASKEAAKTERARKIVENFVFKVKDGRVLTAADIDRFFDELYSEIGSKLTKDAVAVAVEASVHGAGPAYRSAAGDIIGDIRKTQQLYGLEAASNLLRKVTRERASLPETERFMELLEHNLRVASARDIYFRRGGMGGLYEAYRLIGPTPAATFVQPAVAVSPEPLKFIKLNKTNAPTIKDMIGESLFNRLVGLGQGRERIIRGIEVAKQRGGEAGIIRMHLGPGKGVPLEIPIAYGPNQSIISLGEQFTTAYMPGRFEIYDEAGRIIGGKPMSFTETALWRVEQELLGKGVLTDRIGATRAVKEFRQSLTAMMREYTPLPSALAAEGLPQTYLKHRAGYITRLRWEGGELKEFGPPTELTGEAGYAGVGKSGIAKGVVSTTPVEKMVPFGWHYEEGGVTKPLWGTGERPEMMIRDWAASEEAIRTAEMIESRRGGAPMVHYPLSGDVLGGVEDVFTPELFKETYTPYGPDIPVSFVDTDNLRRARKWMADGAGLIKSTNVTRRLMERTSVKSVTLYAGEVGGGRASVSPLVNSLMEEAKKAGGALKIPEDFKFTSAEVAGIEAKTGKLFKFGRDMQPITAEIIEMNVPGMPTPQTALKITYKRTWRPGPNEPIKTFYGGREVLIPARGETWNQAIQELQGEAWLKGVRAPQFAGLRSSMAILPMDVLEKNTSIRIKAMYKGLWEVEKKSLLQKRRAWIKNQRKMLMREFGLKKKEIGNVFSELQKRKLPIPEWVQSSTIEREIDQYYEDLYKIFKTRKVSPGEMERILLRRALHQPYVDPIEMGSVFAPLRYGFLKEEIAKARAGDLTALEAAIAPMAWGRAFTTDRRLKLPGGEMVMSNKRIRQVAAAIAHSNIAFGHVNFASKGPISEYGAGGLPSIEPRGLFLAGVDEESERAFKQAVEARIVEEGAKYTAIQEELGESLASLMGKENLYNVPEIPLAAIPERYRDFADFIAENGGGFYAELPEPIPISIGGEQREISKFYIPRIEDMGHMLGPQTVGMGEIQGYMTGKYHDILGALRRGTENDIAYAREIAETDLARMWGSTIFGQGTGSNIEGMLRGKLPMGAMLTGVTNVPMPKGEKPLAPWEVAISPRRAKKIIGQVARIRGQEEAKLMRDVLFENKGSWSMALWRHPFIHPGSIQTVRVRINKNLHDDTVQLVESLWELQSARHGAKLRASLSPHAAMWGDFDVDLYNLFPLESRKIDVGGMMANMPPREITSPALVEELAARDALIKKAIRYRGASKTMDIGEAEMKAALKAYLEKKETGMLSTSITGMRIGVSEALKAGKIDREEAARALQMLGNLEQLPISARHYDISKMDEMVREAEELSKVLRDITPERAGEIASYLRGAVQDTPVGREVLAMYSGEPIELVGKSVKTPGLTTKLTIPGINLEKMFRKIIRFKQQYANQYRDIRALSSKHGKMSLYNIEALLTGKKKITVHEITEAIATHAPLSAEPESKMASVGRDVLAAKNVMAAHGESMIKHAKPLAFGFAGALAIGSLLSAPSSTLRGHRRVDATPPKRATTDTPFAIPETYGVHKTPRIPRTHAPTAIVRGRLHGPTSWHANVQINTRGNLDAQMLARQIQQATRYRAHVNMNTNYHRRLTKREVQDIIEE